MDFCWLLAPFTALVFMFFFYFCNAFSRINLCIDLLSILAWIFIAFVVFFYYLLHSCLQPFKPSKTHVFIMNFNDLTIQRNMISHDLNGLFVNIFGIAFWWVLASIFGLIFKPLYYKIQCFVVIVLMMFFQIWIVISFDKKMVLADSSRNIPFCLLVRPFCPRTCTF